MMKHRFFAWLLAVVMAVSLLAAPASAFSPNNTNGDWQYEFRSDGICLTKYLGSSTIVTVPAELDGQKVTVIGSSCFKDNTNVSEVTVSHGIRRIGEEAFFGCSGLKTINLGGSVNEIGPRAFAHTGLSSAVIPGSVRLIGEEAFFGCKGLYNIVIDEGIIDLTATEIGGGFGSGSVTLVEGIARIEAKAFFDCANLTMMQVPATVTYIGSQALGYTADGVQGTYQLTGFADTAAQRYAAENGIKFVTAEDDDENSGICGEDVLWSFENGTLTISGTGRMYDYASAEYLPWYALRSEITAGIIEEGVTSLGEYVFSGSAVSKVTLPQTLEVVGKEALANCDSLAEIEFIADAPEFAEDAFLGTTVTAWYPGSNPTWTPDIRKDYGGDVTWMSRDTLPFVDVPVGSFYYDPVAWAVEKGITNGTDATHFSPNAPCQRASVVTFLWRAAGSPAPTSTENPFVDVKEKDFFYKAVLWAVEKGITNGMTTTTFSPYIECNRAQVVTFLWRSQGSPDSAAKVSFTDVKPGQFYTTAVAWAVEKSITTGMSADTFGVENTCNRAQIVTFLYRTMKE